MNFKDNVSIPPYIQELLIASGQGLGPLTSNLATVLNRPVLISTAAYELITASLPEYESELFRVVMDEPTTSHEAIFNCTLSAGMFQSRAVGRVIAPMGRIIGYIFVPVNEELFDREFYHTILDYAAPLYAVHIQGQLKLKKEKQNFKDAFLYDLLYGNLRKKEEIISTGKMWGWDLRCPYTVLILLLPNLESYSPDQHLMDVLSRITTKALNDKSYFNPITLRKQNELIILIPAEETKQNKETITFLAKSILARLTATELENKVICGVGQYYKNAAELFRSYQEAKVAAEVGMLLEITVPFFNEIGLERILYKHDLQDLKEYYDHVLGELHKQDDHNESLIKTLESFANNQFDVNKTSQAIFLHKNTIRYRLNKIEGILGRSLNDNELRLDIIAAFKIKRLHQID